MNASENNATGKNPNIKVPLNSTQFVGGIAGSNAAQDFVAMQYVRLLYNTEEPPLYVDQNAKVRVYNLDSIRSALDRKFPVSEQDGMIYVSKVDDPVLLDLIQKKQTGEMENKNDPVSLLLKDMTVKEIIDTRIYSLEKLVSTTYTPSDMETLRKLRNAKQEEQNTLSRILDHYPGLNGVPVRRVIAEASRTMPLEGRRLEYYNVSVELYKRVLRLDAESDTLSESEFRRRVETQIAPLERRMQSLGTYDSIIEGTKSAVSTIDSARKNKDITEILLDFGIAAGCGITAGIVSHNIGAAGITGTAVYYILQYTRKGITSTISNVKDYTKEKTRQKIKKLEEIYRPNGINLKGFWAPGVVYSLIGGMMDFGGKAYHTGLKTWYFISNHLAEAQAKIPAEEITNKINTYVSNYQGLPGTTKFLLSFGPLLATYMLAGTKIGNYPLGRIPKQNINGIGNFIVTAVKDVLFAVTLGWNFFPAYYIKKGANALFANEFETFKEQIKQKYDALDLQLREKYRIKDVIQNDQTQKEQTEEKPKK